MSAPTERPPNRQLSLPGLTSPENGFPGRQPAPGQAFALRQCAIERLTEPITAYLCERLKIKRDEINSMFEKSEMLIHITDSVARLCFASSSFEPINLISITALGKQAGGSCTRSDLLIEKFSALPIFACATKASVKRRYVPDEPEFSKAAWKSLSAYPIISVSDHAHFAEAIGLPSEFDLQAAIGEGMVRLKGSARDCLSVEIFGTETDNKPAVVCMKNLAKQLGVGTDDVHEAASSLGLCCIETKPSYGRPAGLYLFQEQAAALPPSEAKPERSPAPERAATAERVAKPDERPPAPERAATAERVAKPDHTVLSRPLAALRKFSPAPTFQNDVVPRILFICSLFGDRDEVLASLLKNRNWASFYVREPAFFEDMARLTRVFSASGELLAKPTKEAGLRICVVVGQRKHDTQPADVPTNPEPYPGSEFFHFYNQKTKALEFLVQLPPNPKMSELVAVLLREKNREYALPISNILFGRERITRPTSVIAPELTGVDLDSAQEGISGETNTKRRKRKGRSVVAPKKEKK